MTYVYWIIVMLFVFVFVKALIGNEESQKTKGFRSLQKQALKRGIPQKAQKILGCLGKETHIESEELGSRNVILSFKNELLEISSVTMVDDELGVSMNLFIKKDNEEVFHCDAKGMGMSYDKISTYIPGGWENDLENILREAQQRKN